MQFRPRILDIRHNYNRQRLVGDLGAGATVGVVALPLAMAFAIASGLPPKLDCGLPLLAALWSRSWAARTCKLPGLQEHSSSSFTASSSATEWVGS